MPKRLPGLPVLTADRQHEAAMAAAVHSNVPNPIQPEDARNHISTLEEDAPPNVKKRQRTEPVEGEEKKRGRGRPRLNASDETAAERRRTQIRLAQRAYRNRKENAISTLEQQVRDLADNNKEMSSAFAALQEFVASRGLFDQAPEFGALLKAQTDRFQAIAKQSSVRLDDQDDSDSSTLTISKSESPSDRKPLAVLAAQAPAATTGHEAVVHHGMASPLLLHNSPEDSRNRMIQQQSATPLPPGSLDSSELEVITQATYENASFPFTFSDPQLSSVFGEHSPLQLAPPPLPPPHSYASAESTFGRRLQRFALECGLKLISTPNPPPLPLVRVFGLCLPFETPEMIRNRLLDSLHRNEHESLNFWEYPFHNLGGAGTHFPPVSGPPVGNHGTADLMHHRMQSGFSMGPYTKPVSDYRDKLDIRQRVSVPGFQGNFYDAEDVEIYLRHKGVLIPPRQDLITLLVDLSAFEHTEEAADTLDHMPTYSYPTAAAPAAPAAASGVSLGPAFMGITSNSSADHLRVDTAMPGGRTTTNVPMPFVPQTHVPMVPWNQGFFDTSCAATTISPETAAANPRVFQHGYPVSNNQYSTTTTAGMMSSLTAPIDFGAGEMLGFSPQIPQYHPNPPPNSVVIFDVNLFITKLTATTTCLGRTPGFRLENVNKAFLAAIHS